MIRLMPVCALAALAACSPYRQVYSVGDVAKNDKVVIGKIEVVGGSMSDWAWGSFEGVDLIVSYDLPISNGRAAALLLYGQPLASDDGKPPMGPRGGVFHMSVENQPVYLLSLKPRFNAVLVSGTVTAPLLLKIRPSGNRCEYVGRILVTKTGERITTEIVDDYERDRDAYAKLVQGCDLRKSLAANVDNDDIIQAIRAEAASRH